MLEYLVAGDTFEDLLAEFPDLERDDLRACLEFAVPSLKLICAICVMVWSDHSDAHAKRDYAGRAVLVWLEEEEDFTRRARQA